MTPIRLQNVKWLIAAALALAAIETDVIAAERDALKPTVALFAAEYGSIQLNALVEASITGVGEVFDRLGRFRPLDYRLCSKALKAQSDQSQDDPFSAAARSLGADLCAVLSILSAGQEIVVSLELKPLNESYRRLDQTITVRSAVPMNIPLKLARAVAAIHRDLPVEAEIIERSGISVRLNVGQWHGLMPGRYRIASGLTIHITHTNRYRSIAALPFQAERGSRIVILSYPRAALIERECAEKIEANTERRYGLAASGLDNPEKKFLEAVVVINPGANILLPGYGAFLATSYLGFRQTKPSVAGIAFSLTLVATHFILPEAMGRFKVNFFPGVMDSDKTPALNNLQIFLWSTLPLTASAAFFDQLAYQYDINTVLPPFFLNKDAAALVLSALLPGAGMFYKGWRVPGWGFYCAEMFLAGFCVYRKDARKEIVYAGIALAAVKIADLAAAFFSPPSYGFYNIEIEGRISAPALSMEVRQSMSGEPIYRVGAVMAF